MFPKLKGVLAELGWSQQQLSDELTKAGYPISRTNLNYKLNGKVSLTYEDMQWISKVVNKTPIHLFF